MSCFHRAPDRMRRWGALAVAVIALAGGAKTAAAKVDTASDTGFTVSHEGVVAASARSVWAALIKPSIWWSPAHSYSGAAKNFSLDRRPGGCFCEALPKGGGVQHARVLYVAPEKTLRLSGALGPLQGEALTGTLTITLKPADKGTNIRFDYVVGGYARFDLKQIAPAVDAVIGEQRTRLARLIETGRADAPTSAPSGH